MKFVVESTKEMEKIGNVVDGTPIMVNDVAFIKTFVGREQTGITQSVGYSIAMDQYGRIYSFPSSTKVEIIKQGEFKVMF